MGVRTNRHQSGMLSIAMLATAVLLAAISVAKVTRVFVVSSRLEEATKKNGITATPSQDQIDKAMAADRAVAEGLKRANLFAPPPPRRNPVQEVYAILGSEVLINGRWYKSGEKVQDANIVSVEPTHVVVEWNGQRTNLYPIQASMVAADTSSRSGRRSRETGGGGPGMMGGGPIMTAVGGRVGGPGGGGGPGGVGGPGGGGGPGGMFGNMSDAERHRIQDMSSDERRNFFMQRMQEFGGGQGGMRGGMMGGGDGGRGGGDQQRGGGGPQGGDQKRGGGSNGGGSNGGKGGRRGG